MSSRRHFLRTASSAGLMAVAAFRDVGLARLASAAAATGLSMVRLG